MQCTNLQSPNIFTLCNGSLTLDIWMTIIENALYQNGVGIQNEVSPDLPLQITIKKNDPTPSKVPFWRVLRS